MFNNGSVAGSGFSFNNHENANYAVNNEDDPPSYVEGCSERHGKLNNNPRRRRALEKLGIVSYFRGGNSLAYTLEVRYTF